MPNWASLSIRLLLRMLVAVLVLAAARTEGIRAARLRADTAKDSGVQSAIVGGTRAPRGRYPWVASLRVNNGSLAHFCGASLVAPQIVMTAAHCLVEANGSWSVAMYSFPQVRLGGWELNGGVYEAHEVLRACVHESYNAVTNANDVALLLLNSTSKLTPVKLPPSTPDPAVPNGTPLRTLGWGALWQSGPLARNLMEVGLDSISNCNRWIPRNQLDRSMVCAGSPRYGKDACQGDSGGALFRPGANASSDLQLGIVSWGYGCAWEGAPGVYSNVPYLSSWVRQKVTLLQASAALQPIRRQQLKPQPGPPPPSVPAARRTSEKPVYGCIAK
ncbi:hypothetical protein ABPG77_008910 [Micractinium sp. CCAP 211/92]